MNNFDFELDKNKTACFTGHRTVYHSNLTFRLNEIIRILIDDGFENFICGGALGFDTLAEHTILDLKKEFPQIKLILALPYLADNNGMKYYPYRDGIADMADKIVYVEEKYTRGCMHIRNQFMIEHSSACITYKYKNSGGTAYTETCARQKGLTIISTV